MKAGDLPRAAVIAFATADRREEIKLTNSELDLIRPETHGRRIWASRPVEARQ
jgi:hypothetical protein